MNLIDVSIFSKDDRITRCHPIEKCFFLCPFYNRRECGEFWHLYNITKERPLPASKIMDFKTFMMLRRRKLDWLGSYYKNMKGRIE